MMLKIRYATFEDFLFLIVQTCKDTLESALISNRHVASVVR